MFIRQYIELEAKGFGDIAKKRRNKRAKYLSKRTAKIKDLKDRPTSWQGLENFDVFS